MSSFDVEVVLATASLAPSIHNSQPWQLSLRAQNTLVVELDESPRLRWADRDGRLAFVSCGTAVEYARLAIRGLGFACHIGYADDSKTVGATLEVGELSPTTYGEQKLIDGMAVRYTDRGPYEDRPVPYEIFSDTSHLVGPYGVVVKPVLRHDDRLTIIYTLFDAEAAEAADPEYLEEISRFVTNQPMSEGIPLSAIPAWPTGRVSELPLRQFPGAAVAQHSGASEPPTVERDPVAILITPGDEARDWISTGRAFAALSLRAATDGVTNQPLGPAVDLPVARYRLRKELGLFGCPQFLMRLGYGVGQPTTRRRVELHSAGSVN